MSTFICGAGLLKAILDDPSDNTLRLIYADWLEENGNPVRAEFIRVQLQVTGCIKREPGVMISTLLKREKYLRNELYEYGAWAIFKRGMVSEVRLPCAEFMLHARYLFSENPIERVVLTNKTPNQQNFGIYWWYGCSEAEEGSEWEQNEFVIPRELFILIDGGLSRVAQMYLSEAMAIDALSEACVRYGISTRNT